MTTEADAPPTSPTPNEHEDPSLSSASLCIQFDLLGEKFGPVFTHQAFPGEAIRGYHPPLKTLMELESTNRSKAQADPDEPSEKVLVHSSHIHHEAASKELSIDVKLSPSCQVCQVDICTEQKRLPRRQSSRASKRRRMGEASDDSQEQGNEDSSARSKDSINNDEHNDEDDDAEEKASDNDNASEAEYNEEEDNDEEEKDDDSEFEVDGNVSEVEEEEEKEGSTRKSRKPTKEILQSMKKGLPSVTEKKVDDRFLTTPLGTELKEFSVKGKDFVLCLANGADAAKFHREVQRLALWFIETADDVDVASKEGGFWKVLYLFQKHKQTQYSLAGFTTLFHFHAPFKKPKAGYVVRICQALVLPPYQRSGHGKEMLTAVMDIAHGRYAEQLNGAKKGEEGDDDIVEINVECPAPAFILLRNRTDYDCYLQSIESKDRWFDSDISNVGDEDFFTSLSESDLLQVAAKAKIIPRQIQIVQELFKLERLHDHLMSTGKVQKEELEKGFRLMVKKRLNKENREHLSGFRTKTEKQGFLEEEFSKCLESYRTTLRLSKIED